MNTNAIETTVMDAEKIEIAESMSFAEMVAALAMESADCYSEI
jgi:hypothetical protein